MKIIRRWKDGRKDLFTVDELQNKILATELSSDPFKPKKYKPFEINGIPIGKYEEELPDENIVDLEDKEISVSNFGRVFNVNKKIVLQKEKRDNPKNEWEQTSWYVDIPGKYTGYVYKLVAEAFFIPSSSCGYEIHHISGNALDNRAENLIYLTREEHSEIEPYKTLNEQICQEIKMLDWENFLLDYESANIVNNVEISISDENIFSDFCYRKFKFSEVEISYDYYIGGSKDNIKMTNTIRGSGMGKFMCSGSNIRSIDSIDLFNNRLNAPVRIYNTANQSHSQ
ncbi:MAG: HNH endonuclease [Bacteroidales bacterium]|jgi:hypothetical protein|nr:HNH endonuclease [Bacteroidales bacterium]